MLDFQRMDFQSTVFQCPDYRDSVFRNSVKPADHNYIITLIIGNFNLPQLDNRHKMCYIQVDNLKSVLLPFGIRGKFGENPSQLPLPYAVLCRQVGIPAVHLLWCGFAAAFFGNEKCSRFLFLRVAFFVKAFKQLRLFRFSE